MSFSRVSLPNNTTRFARCAAGSTAHPSVGSLTSVVDGSDNHNMDVWESEEAFAAFGQDRLGPAMASVGVNVEPRVTFYAAHEVFLPKALTLKQSS